MSNQWLQNHLHAQKIQMALNMCVEVSALMVVVPSILPLLLLQEKQSPVASKIEKIDMIQVQVALTKSGGAQMIS